MNDKYKVLEKKKIYNGFFKLHEIKFIHLKHNGSWSRKLKREIFGGSHVAGVIPYDPIKKEILLLSQFRAATIKRKDNPLMIEIVAGMIDKGETPKQAAKRECLEETGCVIKKLININSFYPAPGSSESYYHLFLGEVDAFEGQRNVGKEDENEDILVKSYKVNSVRKLLKQKKIINGLTLIALQWFFLEYFKD